jgi:hypothetical protein
MSVCSLFKPVPTLLNVSGDLPFMTVKIVSNVSVSHRDWARARDADQEWSAQANVDEPNADALIRFALPGADYWTARSITTF